MTRDHSNRGRQRAARLRRRLVGAASIGVFAAGALAATATNASAAAYKSMGFVEVDNVFSAAQAPSIHPGQRVPAGYEIQMTGALAAQTVTVTSPVVWLQVACQPTVPSGGDLAGQIRIDLGGGPYTTTSGSSEWTPSVTSPDIYNDGSDPLTYQGEITAPDLCNGAAMWINAETFQADVSSTSLVDPLLERFHVATGAGALDCANAIFNPAPGISACASTWSDATSRYPAPAPTADVGTMSRKSIAATATPTAPTADPTAPGFIMINGSMEGDLKITPGDWIGGGYQFDIPGNHPASTVTFNNATLTLNISCNSNGSSPFPYTFPLAKGPYAVAANSSAKYPYSPADSNGSNQGDPAKWEGTLKAPDLCAGGIMHVNAQSGAATFEANVDSTDTTHAIQVQFHYIDSQVKNQPTMTDCANTTQNPPPGSAQCGASWSGTPTVTPGPPPPPPTNIPDGAPLLLAVAGSLGGAAALVQRRRGARGVPAAG